MMLAFFNRLSTPEPRLQSLESSRAFRSIVDSDVKNERRTVRTQPRNNGDGNFFFEMTDEPYVGYVVTLLHLPVKSTFGEVQTTSGIARESVRDVCVVDQCVMVR